MENDASIRDAVRLNNLDDWGEFHRTITSGCEVGTGTGIVTGGCHCASVRYRAKAVPIASYICHCLNCRRATGAPFVGWLSFSYKDFEFIKGQPTRYPYCREDGVWAERGFCRRCGTQLTYDRDDADSIDVTTVSLDDPDAFPPDSHE